MMQPRTHAPGTMQLDAYVGEGKITSRPPPDLAFEDTMEPLPATQEDAEERWMDDAPWADEEAYLLADIQGQEDTDSASTAAPNLQLHRPKHGAAMELAPSKSPFKAIQDEPPTAAAEPAETPAPQDEDNVRVRILETMPEPVMDASGEPLVLEVGDVHFLDEGMAAWLIDAGVAERAEL